MKHPPFLHLTRLMGFVVTVWVWRVIQFPEFSRDEFFIILIVPIISVFPVVWIGRKTVDAGPTLDRLAWITSFVHIMLMMLFGVSIIGAIRLFQVWPGVPLPVPVGFATLLLWLSGACVALTVVNLALSGLGAPFAIALSRRLANRWMYRWTRNPMVLSTIATLIAAGLYLQSLYFVLWALLLVTPAWLFFLRVYEERELEIRFGRPYTDYKAATPFLWPRKPRG